MSVKYNLGRNSCVKGDVLGGYTQHVIFGNDKTRDAYKTLCRTSIRRGLFIIFENSSTMDVAQGPK